jgi:hypothetical protein
VIVRTPAAKGGSSLHSKAPEDLDDPLWKQETDALAAGQPEKLKLIFSQD